MTRVLKHPRADISSCPAPAVELEESWALNFWVVMSGHKLGFAANG